MSDRPIRLKATDAEDLSVIAACLQDAIVPLAEMRFFKDEKRFVMLVNRFRWEQGRDTDLAQRDADFSDASAGEAHGEQRIHSGLCIDHVVAVRSRGIDRDKPGRFLMVMTMGLDGPQTLNLLFSGGGVMQFEIETLSLFLQDFGEAWPTQWRPDHALDLATPVKGRGR
ncbi:MAG TPA: DUF2948 family protein [Candidatus Binatia bacterium]|nr:DUF2948 family protein [Candidatus Binatia bacterium]